jgi:hypothetical protein
LKISEGEEEFEDMRGRRRVLFFSLWYLQTLLLPLISSNSSSPSGIFKLFFSEEFEDTKGRRRV